MSRGLSGHGAQSGAGPSVDNAHATGLTVLDQTGQNFSWCAWINPRAMGATGRAMQNTLWNHTDDNAAAVRNGMHIRCNLQLTMGMALRIADASVDTIVNSTLYWVTRFMWTWLHLAITYDGANVRFYINGALVTTGASTATPGSAGTRLTQIGGFAGGNETMMGQLYDVQVYPNKCLSSDEIQRTMDPQREQLPDGCKQRICRWWGYQGASSLLKDESGSGTDLTTASVIPDADVALQPVSVDLSPGARAWRRRIRALNGVGLASQIRIINANQAVKTSSLW